MQHVVIAHNPFDESTWREHHCEDIRSLLTEQFEQWPASARIYHTSVSMDNDVTPSDEASIKLLGELEGQFVVVVYPGTPLVIAIVAIVAVVVLAVAIYFLTPKVPAINQRNQIASSNNSLSDRGNQARVGSRVADIYGQVRSYFDMLMLPYRKFVNNIEVEVCYFCATRGAALLEDIKDDTTPYAQIASASLEVYAPFTSPNSGSPEITVGASITEDLVIAKRFTTVDGQVLKSPVGASTFTVGCTFVAPNKIQSEAQIEVGTINTHDLSSSDDPQYEDVDLTNYFNSGDVIQLATGDFVSGATTINLSASNYVIATVTPLEITLVTPAAQNAAWTTLAGLPGGSTSSILTNMSASGSHYIGWFTINVPEQNTVSCNMVALGGLFKDDGNNQYATSVTGQIELQPCNNDGVPTGGATEIFAYTMTGSSVNKDQVGLTVDCTPTFTGPANVRNIRTSATDTGFKGTVVDEVKWRDVYGKAPVTQADFGDVTTVYARTVATISALAVKDRKLNALVTRKLPARIGTTSTFGALTPTTSAADILCAITLDPYIGNRQVSELDVSNIYDTVASIVSYFNTDECGQFCYTFDDNNISFEETFATIAGAVFCQGYRRGNQIKIFFEKATPNSTLLFNHRNKVPDSEVRTVRFGILEDTDGVEYTYTSPDDDAPLIYYIPLDRTAVNPKKIDGTGIRSIKQAKIQAWRAWNKLRYQYITTQFEALKEAELIVLGQRILVADNTRSDTQDGEVIDQNVLTLTLSQNVTLVGGDNIFLQLSNQTTQSIAITAGPNPNQVVLAVPPTVSLVYGNDVYASTFYQIVVPSPARGNAFLLADRQVASKETRQLTAINYDDRYYQHDLDFFAHFDSTIITFDDTVSTWDAN